MHSSRHRLLKLALTGAFLFPAAAAHAAPGDFMVAGSEADAPLGFAELCQREADLCRGTPGAGLTGTATITAPRPVGLPLAFAGRSGTAAIDSTRSSDKRRTARRAPMPRHSERAPMRTLKTINREVNRQVVQVSDLISTGVEERWDRPGRFGRPAGDCEDVAIEKRMRLIEAGFPVDRLFYAVVFRPNFGLHTILVAQLDEGDFVLDSATPRIVKWSAARYVWLRMQSKDDPLHWNQIAAT